MIFKTKPEDRIELKKRWRLDDYTERPAGTSKKYSNVYITTWDDGMFSVWSSSRDPFDEVYITWAEVCYIKLINGKGVEIVRTS